MASGRLVDYLGKGLAADRPVSLSLHPDALGLYYSTDTGDIDTWDGSMWNAVVSGSGDVVGPASSTDSNVALFDGITGKLLKDGGTLGTAAFSDDTDFATAAQGTTADSAIQPGDLAAVATSGDAADLAYDNTASGLTATNAQDAIDELAATGGGGGDVTKIAEVIVTGSAVTDIDFSSLDLDADKCYRLEVYVVPGATGAHVTSLLYNGDTTQGNYQRNSLSYLGTVADIARTSNAYIHYTDSLPNTTNPYSFGVAIRKVSGAKPLAEVGSAASCDSGGNVFITSTVQRWNNTTNVTSIKLRNLVTNGYGVGTFARLYKMN